MRCARQGARRRLPERPRARARRSPADRQNGGKLGDWHAPDPRTPGIYAIDLDEPGDAELVTAYADGRSLRRPNDLCFARDGSLWFTDPGDYDTGRRRGRLDLPARRRAHVESRTSWATSIPTASRSAAQGRPRDLGRDAHPSLQRRADGVSPTPVPMGRASGFGVRRRRDRAGRDRLLRRAARRLARPTARARSTSCGGPTSLLPSNCAFDGSVLWATDATSGWERSDDYQAGCGGCSRPCTGACCGFSAIT